LIEYRSGLIPLLSLGARPAFTGPYSDWHYEIRTVAVEEADGTRRIALRDGWPAT
jgi:hypothetical protein